MRFTSQAAKAYAASNYWIMLPDGVLFLRPWVKDRSLYDLHKEWHAKCSAILSPCNPDGEHLSERENRKRLRSFAELLDGKWPYFLCGGASLGGTNKAEISYFIIGIDKVAALKFGNRFGQQALVFCRSGRSEARSELLACKHRHQHIFDKIKKQKLRKNRELSKRF